MEKTFVSNMVKALIIAKFVASFKSFLNTKINKIKVANELLITLFEDNNMKLITLDGPNFFKIENIF
tara:strand:- start:1376 stop:1576 length:201 start_codon:yes stop_codon:yes gene_type:complete